MIKITRFFYIHILVVPLVVLSFAIGSPTTFFITYGIVLIHELFHLFAALCLQVSVGAIVLMPFGMTLRLPPKLIQEPKKEVLIAMAGPFSNLLMLTAALLFFPADNINCALFIVCNAAILLLNLIPIPPLDGGRILRSVLVHRLGLMPGAKFLHRLSLCMLILLSVAGASLIVYSKGNPSLLIVVAFLAYSLVAEKKNSDILVMRMLMYEKESLKNGGFIPTRKVTLHKSAPAKRILSKLNYSSFYMVTVLDDNLSVIITLTESDILRSVTQKGYGIRLSDCL